MKSQNKQSVWTCMSEKAFSADVHWMTIFTPAYQREATMECFYRTLITDVYSFIGQMPCAGVYACRLFAFKKIGLYILLCHVKTKSKKTVLHI